MAAVGDDESGDLGDGGGGRDGGVEDGGAERGEGGIGGRKGEGDEAGPGEVADWGGVDVPAAGAYSKLDESRVFSPLFRTI